MSNLIPFPLSRTRPPGRDPWPRHIQAPRVVYNWRAKIYHQPECRYANGNYRQVSIKQAEKYGARPCKACKGQESRG